MENPEKATFPQRYVEFLEEFKLTPNSLAAALGDKSKVKYHNYKTGEAEPNTKTLALIATHFPINTDWLVAGIGPMMRDTATAGSISDDGIDWKTRCLEMESRFNQVIAAMTTKYDTLMNEYKALLEKTVRKLDPSLFSESDSRITVFSMPRNLIGYGRESETECKVIPHPASIERDYVLVDSEEMALIA